VDKWEREVAEGRGTWMLEVTWKRLLKRKVRAVAGDTAHRWLRMPAAASAPGRCAAARHERQRH